MDRLKDFLFMDMLQMIKLMCDLIRIFLVIFFVALAITIILGA